MSLFTALLSVAAAHPDKFLLDRGLAVCTDDIMGSNIKDGSLCLTRRASAASADEVAMYKLGGKYGFAFGSAASHGRFRSRRSHALRTVLRQVYSERHKYVAGLRLLGARGYTRHNDNQDRGFRQAR